MMVAGKKKLADCYKLKKGLCPVNGMNSYSVFKKGVLVFMMDGDRAFLFSPEDVEAIPIDGYPGLTVYRVGKWVFTGGVAVTDVLIRKLPKGCLVCSAVDKRI